MSIYKQSEICGAADKELTPELYRRWGVALGCRVEPGAKFVAGGDARASTPGFLAALVDGLCEAGVDVVELGVLPTPMIHYARRRLDADGAAIVTASHEHPDVNGLSWRIAHRPPGEKDVRSLKRSADSGCPEKDSRKPTTPRTLDVSFDYVASLQELWMDAPAVKRPIVLDCLGGVWTRRARRYLQAIFPHSLISAVHDTPDEVLAGQVTDWSRPESLHELADAVYQERALLGIAPDAEGNHVAFVDDEGIPLSADEATWVLLQSYGKEISGESFVHDIKFSDRLSEAARKLRAEPVAERPDHAAIYNRMIESNAPFGAQADGHYFFGALGGEDDGLFAACRMIAHLAGSGKTLSKLRRKCPKIFMTPDLRVRVKARYRQEVVDRVRKLWSKYPQTEIDGVRIDLPDGWVLVRNPASDPGLVFRFEGRDWKGLAKLVSKVCDRLKEVGEALWASYEDAAGLEYGED